MMKDYTRNLLVFTGAVLTVWMGAGLFVLLAVWWEYSYLVIVMLIVSGFFGFIAVHWND